MTESGMIATTTSSEGVGLLKLRFKGAMKSRASSLITSITYDFLTSRRGPVPYMAGSLSAKGAPRKVPCLIRSPSPEFEGILPGGATGSARYDSAELGRFPGNYTDRWTRRRSAGHASCTPQKLIPIAASVSCTSMSQVDTVSDPLIDDELIPAELSECQVDVPPTHAQVGLGVSSVYISVDEWFNDEVSGTRMLTKVVLLFLLLGRETLSAEDGHNSVNDTQVPEEPSCAANLTAPNVECANSTSNTVSPSSHGTPARNDSRRISCEAPVNPVHEVMILNATRVSEVLSAARNECTLLVFYRPTCMFSVRSAPYLNGIARYYTNVSVIAIQIDESSNLNTNYGIIATPTVLLLHNHRAIAKLNHTNVSLDALGSFIEKHTGLPVVENMTLSELDYQGPLPTKIVERADWTLFAAWAFTIWSLLWFVLRSSYAFRAYTWLATTWKEAREAEQAARPHQE